MLLGPDHWYQRRGLLDIGVIWLPNYITVEFPEIFKLGELMLESKFCDLVTLFFRRLYLTILISSFSFENVSQLCENVDFSMNRNYLSALP